MPADTPPPSDWSAEPPCVVHGTCVALGGAGLLLVGPSGSGKSSLALQLLALGAGLVSDDLTRLEAQGGRIRASCPSTRQAPFGIEARGIGLLRAAPAGPAPLHVVVDLARAEPARLPPPHHVHLAGHAVRILARVESPAFPAMLIHVLRHGFLPC